MDQDTERDLAAIKRLHDIDMRASKEGDFATLRTLMTADAVVLPPGGRPISGRDEIAAHFVRTKAAMRRFEVLDYVLDFAEVRIAGDYAFEWGEIRGSMRVRPDGRPAHSSYKVMRILQKQSDGEWKVHRTIWNENA
ncbi:YybH family protein [Arthrobacter mobilis]|uniref:SgcJ/EcaC family oxidoreductase n=1 Tax=Arthrobacter mobilis TaxID=2724944 RepID=A0A7X6HER1_9MICC|nr:SgcJ/EcaC family oxidoreductase [Arthrobacter mobilis]NKX54636.1 SgcJ/EcaC family oxidoreductase [Arthrobacter mobilis]